jgi:hypothetical protein
MLLLLVPFIGLAGAALTVLILVLLPAGHCPQCNAVIPKWPSQIKERGWKIKKRGWSQSLICGQCGCEIRGGKKVTS